MITPLLLAALQASPAAPPPDPDPFDPIAVLVVPEVGQLVVATSPSPGLSAVRIFVPAPEGSGEAGAARVLTELATERVRGVAARTGARFSATRDSRGIAYSVWGSDLDLDYLFLVAGRAAAEPADGRVALRSAVQHLVADLEPTTETGLGWVLSSLTDQMCPTATPWTGTIADLEALDAETLRRFWARTHQPGAWVVSVATALPTATVLAGLGLLAEELPDSSMVTEAAPSPGAGPRSRAPAALKRWYGEARPLPAGSGATALVLGELLATGLTPAGDGFELFAQIRDTSCGQAMVSVGSSYRAGARVMRRQVADLIETLSARVTASQVAAAASLLRLETLAAGDSPEGRARAVGAAFEGRLATSRLAADLREVDVDDVLSLLSALRATVPLRAEVNP